MSTHTYVNDLSITNLNIDNLCVNVKNSHTNESLLSIMSFNIEGLFRIQNELDISSLISKYDFVFLMETFVKYVPDTLTSSHLIYNCHIL